MYNRVAAFRLPKLPAGPPKFMKVLNSLNDMPHEGEHLAHAKYLILRCAHHFSLIVLFFCKILYFFEKPWNASFSGHRIFPDMALAQHQDTYHSFSLTISQLNPWTGSRARALFVPRNYK